MNKDETKNKHQWQSFESINSQQQYYQPSVNPSSSGGIIALC